VISSLANIVANLPKIGIPPTAAGWFWRCRLALNLPKGVFFARINPLNPGYPMLSQKRLVDTGIDLFTSKNWLVTAYIHKICCSFHPGCFFLPL
jgi:hypothetical protein